MKTPKLDSEFLEQVKETQTYMQKQNKRSYIKNHVFDILNFVIALLALIVAFLGLFLP